jgi:hypothetical protein
MLVWSGDDKVITVTVYDNDDVVVDITSATITYQLSQNVKSAAIISKTVGSGITLTDPTSGVFTITFDPADTASLSGRYYHECEITDTSGDVSTGFVGYATIKEDAI